MVSLLGESGSGKTTIRRYAMDRIQSEGQKIKIIAPRSIDKGKLTTSAICDAIIQDCSAERPRRTLEAKSRQVEKILVNSSRAGYNHVLMLFLCKQKPCRLKSFCDLICQTGES